VFIARVNGDETKEGLSEQAGTEENLTFDPKILKTPRK
jgi:hypothetical protein